jgi:hypothetical protein
LEKHRLRRPAVACLFISRDLVLSEASCTNVCAVVEAVRTAARRRNALLVLVLLSAGAVEPLPEDKITLLCRRGSMEARHIVNLAVSGEGAILNVAELRRLSLTLQETAASFYRAEGARTAAKATPRVVSESSVRIAYKVCSSAAGLELAHPPTQAAVYAEFRQDWVTALQFYRAAFATLADLPSGGLVRCCAHVLNLAHLR